MWVNAISATQSVDPLDGYLNFLLRISVTILPSAFISGSVTETEIAQVVRVIRNFVSLLLYNIWELRLLAPSLRQNIVFCEISWTPFYLSSVVRIYS